MIQMAARRDQEEELAKKRQLKMQKFIVYGLAHAKVIMQDYPGIMKQSTEYLIALAEKANMFANTKLPFSKNSIAEYFSQLFMKKTIKTFYNYSTNLLNKRLLEIIQEFHESQLQYPP
jgi:hypothetical protein